MNSGKAAKAVSNVIYSLGAAIVICLAGISLLGSKEAVYPDAMIPYSWRELSFIWLAAGSIPMLLACMAVYKFNAIKNSVHKKRNFILLFLPGLICSACLLFIIGIIMIMMMNAMLHLLQGG